MGFILVLVSVTIERLRVLKVFAGGLRVKYELPKTVSCCRLIDLTANRVSW